MSKSWEQILGGYATGTLTEEEKRQLFEAALDDQLLFDALADEEALKALLADPEARQRILATLQESGHSQGIIRSHGSWMSWFSQPSSLAWAGSIAAMGLALIFGWQMEKDWGPVVQQEQQVEPFVSEDKGVMSSPSSEMVEIGDQRQDAQKKDYVEPGRIASLPAPVSPTELPAIPKASKDTERMRQNLATTLSEGALRQQVKEERRLKVQEPVALAPESVIVQSVVEKDQLLSPSVASPQASEERHQSLPRSQSFADPVQKRDAISLPNARELFYANKEKRSDEARVEIDGMRAQQPLGRMSSHKKVLQEEFSDLKETQKAVRDESVEQRRGLRYGFSRRAMDGKDEAIAITQFSGNWSELQLVIESNTSGYLYVLVQYGKGKWQFMSPESLNIPVSSDQAINVQGYQSVNFPLSQIVNTFGKPVVSSITVLLSSTSLRDLEKWLGQGVGSEPSREHLTDDKTAEIFFIDPSLDPAIPLRVTIALGEE